MFGALEWTSTPLQQDFQKVCWSEGREGVKGVREGRA